MLKNILVILFFLQSSLLFAIGIGDAKVYSYLNQYLLLDIEILGSNNEIKNPDFYANLAAREDFQRAGIEYNTFLVGLKSQVIEKNGKKYLRLTSKNTVKEPFLDILVFASTRTQNAGIVKMLKRVSVLIETSDELLNKSQMNRKKENISESNLCSICSNNTESN